MQDPNADTEWNDVLRSKGIIPPKKEAEISEDDIVNILEQTVQEKQNGKAMDDMSLNELEDIEDGLDDEDERMFEQYRRQRIAEMQAIQMKSKYGEIGEITKADYVREVNEAGEGVWVVLHIYKQGIPLCSLINQHLSQLARKFPMTKFLKSISSVCIPNYPDKNLPTIFVYYESDLKKQWIGPVSFGGMNFKINELEWMLSQVGAVTLDVQKPEKPQIKDVMNIAIRQSNINNDSDDDDY